MGLPLRLTCLVCSEMFDDYTLFDVTHAGKVAICPKCRKLEACSYCGVTLTDENLHRHKDGVCQAGGSD